MCFKSISDILTESDTSRHGMAFISPRCLRKLSVVDSRLMLFSTAIWRVRILSVYERGAKASETVLPGCF